MDQVAVIATHQTNEINVEQSMCFTYLEAKMELALEIQQLRIFSLKTKDRRT